VQAAPRPVAAAEMVLVRLAYAADLPTPDEALRALKQGPMLPSGAEPAPAARSQGAPVSGQSAAQVALATSQSEPGLAPVEAMPAVRLRRFEDLVALAGEHRDIMLKSALERDVRLVRFEEGRLEFSLAEGANRTLAADLARALQAWTGQRWMIALSSEPGAPTLHEQAQASARERKEGVSGHPLVQAVLTKFPGAKVVNVIDRGAKVPDQDADAAPEISDSDAASSPEAEAGDEL
jgi:DNA polymerase III subunit gamma/tau